MRRRTQHHLDTHRVKTLFAKLQKVLEWDHFNRNVIETIQVPAGRSFNPNFPLALISNGSH